MPQLRGNEPILGLNIGIKWYFIKSTMKLMALMSLSLNFYITAMFCDSFSFTSSYSGSTIFPFTISNTVFLARMRLIFVFHALKLEAPSNL
jgi:hypothetical protein